MELNLKSSTYDFLNAVVRYFLPGLGALYFGLSSIWGLPYAEEVVGTIVVITTFLGLVIALARNGWKPDDTLMIDTTMPEHMSFGFKSGRILESLKDGQVLNLKVDKIHYEAADDENYKEL